MVTWDGDGVEDTESERLGAGDARNGWAGMTVGHLRSWEVEEAKANFPRLLWLLDNFLGNSHFKTCLTAAV